MSGATSMISTLLIHSAAACKMHPNSGNAYINLPLCLILSALEGISWRPETKHSSQRHLVMTAEADLVLAVVIPARGWISHVGPDSAQGAEAMLEVVQGARGGLTPQQAQRVHQPWNLHRRFVYHLHFYLLKGQLAELP